MKKILVACIAFLMVASVTMAQHTVPRWGTAPNQNKTYSGLAFGYKAVADVALMDTIKITPSSYNNNIVITLTDTVVLALKSVGDCWVGDQMTVRIENTAGANHFVYFLGTAALATKWRMASTGTTIAMAASKGAIVKFEFNGVYWYEVSRCIQ